MTNRRGHITTSDIALCKVVGKHLRKNRIASGLTLQDIANRLGVSYQQVQKYETGGNGISLIAFLKYLECLNVSIFTFFDGISTVPSQNDLSLTLQRHMERFRRLSFDTRKLMLHVAEIIENKKGGKV